MNRVTIPCLIALLTFASCVSAQKTREEKVRDDRRKVEADGFWIYNDLPKALAEAKKTGKPMLIVFRCIPCEACAQLDAKVLERDVAVQDLMQKFVCLRMVQANGMDLDLFQFDYDQSWAVFFMNADKTIYGRYGTRSHQTRSEDDVSLRGFYLAMQGALALHKEFPKNKGALTAKRGKAATKFKVPEAFPTLKGRYKSKLDYTGQVARSCIHCHQIGEAQRRVLRNAGAAMPETVMRPYPNPKIFGLIMDPADKAVVKSVTKGSSAAKDGFRGGDEILTLAGQPLLSIADVQWVLHNAPATGSLKAEVRRAGKTSEVSLTLAKGWRERDDLSWRSTSWELRRIALGGMRLKPATGEQREKAKVDSDGMALRVDHLGRYGDHALALKTGFRKEDVIVAFDGKSDFRTESDLFAYVLKNHKAGKQVPITIVRGGKRRTIQLKMQ